MRVKQFHHSLGVNQAISDNKMQRLKSRHDCKVESILKSSCTKENNVIAN